MEHMLNHSVILDLLEELELYINLWGKHQLEEITKTNLWEVKPIKNKGLGMIAKQDIPIFSVILVEQFVLSIPLKIPNNTNENDYLLNMFYKLPKSTQIIIEHMTNVFTNDKKKSFIKGIYD
eukprot:141725_1